MNKHTPGPWRAYFSGPAPSVECDGGCPIVAWPGFDDADRQIKEHQANARLTAAAPDLLMACKAGGAYSNALKEYQGAGERGKMIETTQKLERLFKDWHDKTHAAIDKAEGRTS